MNWLLSSTSDNIYLVDQASLFYLQIEMINLKILNKESLPNLLVPVHIIQSPTRQNIKNSKLSFCILQEKEKQDGHRQASDKKGR